MFFHLHNLTLRLIVLLLSAFLGAYSYSAVRVKKMPALHFMTASKFMHFQIKPVQKRIISIF